MGSGRQSAINSTLSPGPALEQARAVPPPAPDLSAGTREPNPGGHEKQVQCCKNVPEPSVQDRNAISKLPLTLDQIQKALLLPHQAHPQKEAASALPTPLPSGPSEAHVPEQGPLGLMPLLPWRRYAEPHAPGSEKGTLASEWKPALTVE